MSQMGHIKRYDHRVDVFMFLIRFSATAIGLFNFKTYLSWRFLPMSQNNESKWNLYCGV